MQRVIQTVVVAVAIGMLPSPAHAMTATEMARSFLCAIRSVFGVPCAQPAPVAPSKTLAEPATKESYRPTLPAALNPSALLAATASSAGAPGAPSTAKLSVATTPQPSLVQPAVGSPDFVTRSEFETETSALRNGLAAAMQQAQSSAGGSGVAPTVLAPLQSPMQSIFVTSTGSGSSKNYDGDIEALWRAVSLTNKIDQLNSVAIIDSTITGATISESTFSGTFSGAFNGQLTGATDLTLTGTLTSNAISASTLTLSGALTAATTTAAIRDTGGQVCNVQAYGAVGNDSTDNYAAIMDAIDSCPTGGIVFFPPGVYRISQTIVLDRPVTLQGTYAPRWSYSSTPRSSIKPTTPFTGSNIVHVRDMSISGEASDNNGGRFINIAIDGNSYGTGVNGIYFEGLVRDWKLDNVDISQTSGDGFEAAQGTGSGNPRGFTIAHLSIYSPALHGFRATALNDSYLEDVLVVGGAQRGFYLSSMGETKINNSRAVFNTLEGLYIDGSTTNGGLQFTDFSTDRNDRHGVRISAVGTTSISFNGLLTRRDGENSGLGSETPYAGVAIIGTSGAQVAPVIISNLTQLVGIDDGGGGTPSPAAGVRVEYADYVRINGILWGTSNSYVDGGNNTHLIIEEDSLLKTGYTTVTTTRYNQKWLVATTTTGVAYTAGRVGIGTTSPTTQLHTTGTVRFENFGSGSLQTDANGNVSVSSDERLKDIQGDYTPGLAAVLKIQPITYYWNEASGFDRETLYAGFSAQNIAETLPEAVGEDKHGYRTLSDRPILAAAITAIQELWKTVTGNTEKIEQLEARVQTLEQKLNVTPPPAPAISTAHPDTGLVSTSSTSTTVATELAATSSPPVAPEDPLESPSDDKDVEDTENPTDSDVAS